MNRQEPNGGWAIAVTFVIAFMLLALPLPDWAETWRPAWVIMTLIYWCLATPQKVGVGIAWLLGLLTDVMTGTLLGQHALGFALVAYITHTLYLQVRVRPAWQQGITVFILVCVANLIVVWTKGISGLPTSQYAVLPPALISAFLWPWVFVMLRDVRRKYKVQ